MDFSTYQRLAARTASPDPDMAKRRLIAALGLTGEAGEVAEVIKKEIGHGHPADAAKIAKEVGDVLWYAALLATLYELDLGEIAAANIEKLRARYPEGFSTEDSLERRDTGKSKG
jgi:NTP pyrophosphatase (non-canonical NTP hydrolase)